MNIGDVEPTDNIKLNFKGKTNFVCHLFRDRAALSRSIIRLTDDTVFEIFCITWLPQSMFVCVQIVSNVNTEVDVASCCM